MNVSQAHLVSLSTCKVIALNQHEVAIMEMNRIQFQLGLSMPDFFKDYGTEFQVSSACDGALAGRVSLPSLRRGRSLRFP